MNKKGLVAPLLLFLFALFARQSLPIEIANAGSCISVSDTFDYPVIKIHLSSRLAPYREDIQNETRQICSLYRAWFGPCPTNELTLIDTALINPASARAENRVIISQRPVPFTRLFQRHIATRIAGYWFDSEKNKEPFLSNGLPAYIATRYLGAVYGDENLLDLPWSIPFLSGASDLYLHRLYYYAAAVNNLSGSLFQSGEKPPDPFTFDAVYKSQAVLIMKILEGELGQTLIDSALRVYRRASPNTPAFLACLTAVAGPQKQVIINRIFQQDGKNDLKITRVRRRAENVIISLSARTPLNLPVELKTVFADNTTRTDTLLIDKKTQITFATAQRVRQVILDPKRKVLEPDRWNNLYPRQVKIKPILQLPDFESYQIFYGPWFWYDNYRGFQPGIWFQGRRMIDAGPVRGEHNWTLLQNYASKKSDWHTGISYQTPLLFYPFRLRLYLAGDNSFRDRGIKTYLTAEFGSPFRLPKNELQFGYRLYELLDTTGRDPRAWQKARTAELRARLCRLTRTRFLWAKHELNFAQGLEPILSQYRYSKIGFEENITIAPFSFRIFAGGLIGSVPPQEEFYLSGGLSYTNVEPVSWAYEGMASGQEHWHYDGDANCRAYYGLYRHGKFAYGININLILNRYVQPFFDLGNVGDSLNQSDFIQPVFDFGIRLKLGPFYADLPFLKSAPEPHEPHFAFRWSLGFKLTELAFGQ